MRVLFTDLQQTNIAKDIAYYGEKLLECVKHLDFDNNKPEVAETQTLKMYCLENEVERLKEEIKYYEQSRTNKV